MKKASLFTKLMTVLAGVFVLMAVASGLAFARLSMPLFTDQRVNEIMPKVQMITDYYRQYRSGNLTLHEMQTALAVSGSLSRAQLSIFGEDGTLAIFSWDKGEFAYPANSPEMRALTSPLAARVIASGTGEHRVLEDEQGRDYIVAAMPVMSEDQILGAVVLTTPMTVVRMPLNGLFGMLALCSTVMFVFMLVLMFFFLRRLVGPLKQMNEVALAMASGDFNQRANEQGTSEVGVLAHSINELAEQLGNTVQALTLERNRLTQMIDGMTEGILALSETGELLHTNRALYALMNIPQGDEEGLRAALIACDETLMQRIKQVADGGEPLDDIIEVEHLALHVIASPIMDDAQVRRGTVALFQDITESQRLEQMRRDYVANVSHELRTPLSAVRGLTEALNDGMIKTSQDRSRYYGYILRECMRLGRLIEDLLELSRVQSRNVALRREKVDLGALLDEMKLRYKTLCEDLEIALEVEAQSGGPLVWSNADRIVQVLVILLDNAFKFTQEGGLVRVYTMVDGQQAHVYVQDSGIGIAQDDLPHVFERFYKAEKAHSGGGTGLGLSIAHEVLLMLDEDLEVSSVPGEGSVFHFTLALYRDQG